MESNITTTEKNYVSTTNTDDNQSLIDDTEFPRDQDVENYYDNEDDNSSKVQSDANTERVNLLKKYKEMLFNNEYCTYSHTENPETLLAEADEKSLSTANLLYLSLLLRNQPNFKITNEALQLINSFVTDISLSLISEVTRISTEDKENSHELSEDQKFLGFQNETQVTKSHVSKAIMGLLEDKSSVSGTLNVLVDGVSRKNLTVARYFGMIDSVTQELIDSTQNNEGWNYVGKNEKIEIYKRPAEGSDIQCVKGTGELNVPFKVVKNVLIYLYHATEWWPLLERVDVIEPLDNYTEITHYRFSTRVCVFKQQRDFVLLRHWYHRQDGSFVLASRSVEHEVRPPTDNYIRGEILTSGFHLLPKEGDPNSCVLVYVANVDPKGTIPDFIKVKFLNIIAEKQPLCIASLRRYLEGLPSEELQLLNSDNPKIK